VTVEPIAGERALWIGPRASGRIAAGDLHIGIEEELERRGFRVPDQTGRTLERLKDLVEAHGPKELILLGDVKHQVPFTERYEARKVSMLLEELCALVPVTVVAGNHDGRLSDIAPEGVRIVGSLVAGDFGFIHGHSWPPEKLMRCKTLVMAHTHPSVLLLDECGRAVTEPCWLRAPFSKRKAAERYKPPFPELIVMPAFGELRSGYPVNERGGRLIGPLLRSGLVNLQAARVYLLDGTFLGRVRDLNISGRTPRGVRN